MKEGVSVIIPCYNQAQFLSDAIKSVLSQTSQEWECIIVNDGSTDNTEEIAVDWCKKDSRFKYLIKENGGLVSARNEGIKIAQRKYILPLDADDKIGSKYLEEAVHILDIESKIGIVYCETEFFGEKSGKWNLPDFSIERVLIMNMIVCSALFRKSDYLETRGYNPNMI
jgi:glycosyltransferase involved in cell wall biosynthesis